MKKENAKNVPPPSFQPQKDRNREDLAKGQKASVQADENVRGRGPRNIQQPKIDRTSGQPQKGGKPESVTADRNGRVHPEEATQGNAREPKGLQAGQQGANRLGKEREPGVKDMAADKQKNQLKAQQGRDQGGRVSNKPNAQPIHDDATQDLRSVAVRAQENSVEQPNKKSPRPPQNRQTKKTQPPPAQRGDQPQYPQQEQQGKKKKKPENNPSDQ
jgi:hypothetical protein